MADQNETNKQDQSTEQVPEKKSNRRGIVIVVVIILVIAAGFYYWRSTFTEDTDDAQVDGDLYQVSARVAGQVVHVDVTDNQLVKAGDPIAEVDPKDFEVALAQAQANLASAQADLEQARVNLPITNVNVRTSVFTSGSTVLGSQASLSQAQANVAAAQSRVDQAQANAVKAQLDVDRYTPLVAKDVISKQQFDAAVQQVNADVRDAILDIQSSAKLVDAAKSNVDLAHEALIEAQERFKTGVEDSLPVSQALSTDEQANDQYISALYQHNVAKLSLARALGAASTNYKDYLGGK